MQYRQSYLRTDSEVESSLDPVESSTEGRILAYRQRRIEPLIVCGNPAGRRSPSPSLLVERFDLALTNWQKHLHVDQVVALYLKPTRLDYAPEGAKAAELQIEFGQAVVCLRDHPESLRWRQAASFLCARVSDAALEEAARSLLGRDRVQLRPALPVSDSRITGILLALEAERTRDYSAGRLFLDGVERALAALLVTSHSVIPSKPVQQRGGLPPQCLRRVLEFMHENISRQVTLEELANCAGMSVSHFAHQFRASTNESPHRYMLKLRIEEGKALLRNPSRSVLEVAVATGFETQQHFATVFRRLTGLSPSRYRQES